jgi:hypothetical protein
MEIRNGAQLVKTIPGRHIVYSVGQGKSNVAIVKWLCESVLKSASSWKTCGWGFISDIQQVDPVDADSGKELVLMTKKLTENGCMAFALIDGSACMLKAQAKANHKRSSSESLQEHFSTLEEALEWMQQLSL